MCYNMWVPLTRKLQTFEMGKIKGKTCTGKVYQEKEICSCRLSMSGTGLFISKAYPHLGAMPDGLYQLQMLW